VNSENQLKIFTLPCVRPKEGLSMFLAPEL